MMPTIMTGFLGFNIVRSLSSTRFVHTYTTTCAAMGEVVEGLMRSSIPVIPVLYCSAPRSCRHRRSCCWTHGDNHAPEVCEFQPQNAVVEPWYAEADSVSAATRPDFVHISCFIAAFFSIKFLENECSTSSHPHTEFLR
jgi:hypothetical protein